MNNFISIIIVAYKSNKFIFSCIRSIFNFESLENFEIIVVDNYPFVSLQEKLADLSEKIIYIKNPINGGYGQGNNIGNKVARGRYLLFLNPDTEFLESTLKYVIQTFNKNNRLAALGLTLVDQNRRINQPSFGIFPESLNIFSILMIKFAPSFFKRIKKYYPWGAGLFIRRDIFNDIGGFDERYFLTFEEPDLVRRIPKNFEVIILKKHLFHHVGHSLNNEKSDTVSNWIVESEKYYFSKFKLNYFLYVKERYRYLKINLYLRSILKMKIDSKSIHIIKYYKSYINSESKRGCGDESHR